MATADDRLGRARSALEACSGDSVYMNIGGAGPLPTPVVRAIERELDAQARAGRASLAWVLRMEALAARLRARVAALIGAESVDLALTQNTTGGINVALWGLDWSPGDQIITTRLEHPGVSVPLGVIARRFGVTLHHLGREEAEGDLEGAVRRAAGARTRAVVLSHVAYGTGAVLDVAGAAAAAEGVGALCVVDGAQSVGAIPVDAPRLGAHVYALPAHKWLYGPEGLGAVWVRPDALDRIAPSFSGYESGSSHTPEGGLEFHSGARRFEMSTPPMALLAGWVQALDWLEDFGWDWVHERITAGRRSAVEALADIEGVAPEGAEGPAAGLLSFSVAGVDPVAGSARLVREGVVVRWLEHPSAMRASIGFHWSQADIRHLARAVCTLVGC